MERFNAGEHGLFGSSFVDGEQFPPQLNPIELFAVGVHDTAVEDGITHGMVAEETSTDVWRAKPNRHSGHPLCDIVATHQRSEDVWIPRLLGEHGPNSDWWTSSGS